MSGSVRATADMAKSLQAHRQEVEIQKKIRLEWKLLNQELKASGVKDRTKDLTNYRKASEAAADSLRGTIKNTEKLGEAIAKDTQFIMDFAKKNKMSVEEAAAMYSKAKEKQVSWLTEGKKKLLEYGAALGSIAAIGNVYNLRIKEIYGGQKLMSESVALTGEEGKKAYAGLQDDIAGYRKAQREAADVAARWGISVDDARQQMAKLGPAIKKSGFKDIGYHVKASADELNKFAFVSGATFEESLETMNDLMYTQGKRFDEAIKDMKMAGGAYENLAKNVKGAAAPTRTQLFTALKDVRTEMGSAHVNTNYMTAAMNKFAEAAVRAGASGKTVGETMRAIPQLARGLPEFFKYQVGREMRAGIESGKEAFKDLPDDVKKQMAAVKKHLGGFQADRASYDILMGTPQGIKSMLKSWKKLPKTLQFDQLTKSLGMDAQKAVSVMEAINSNNEKALDNAAQDIQKGKDELEKQDLPTQLRKNAGATDKMVLAASDLAKQIEGAKNKYAEWLAAGGTVIVGMQKLQSVISMLSMSNAAGSMGALGKVTGLAGKALSGLQGAVGVASAAFIGWEIGSKIDEWTGASDKISSALWKLDEPLAREVERRTKSAGHAGLKGKEGTGSLGYLKTQILPNMLQLAKSGTMLTGEGGKKTKVTKEFIRAQAEQNLATQLKGGFMTKADYEEVMKRFNEDLEKGYQSGYDKRVTAPGPAATGTGGSASLQVTPGTGGATPTAGGTPIKPAKASWDPTAKQLTVINMADPNIVAAFTDMMNTQKSMAPKRG